MIMRFNMTTEGLLAAISNVNESTSPANTVDENVTTPGNAAHLNCVVYAIRVTIIGFVSSAVILTNIVTISGLWKTTQIPQIAKVCLLNLSFADLASGTLSMAPCIVSSVTGVWIYGDVWCQIAGVVHSSCCSISIWSIAVVSVDRYVAIKTPLLYSSRVTSKRCIMTLGTLWALAISTFIMPCLMSDGFIYYQFSPATSMCGLYWEFPWFCIVTGVYIPVASGSIILFTTISIVHKLHHHSKQRNSMPVTISPRTIVKRDTRAIKILILTASMYFIAWGPYVTQVIVGSFSADLSIPNVVEFALLWIANSNSFMNVVIYSAVYRSFRKTAYKLIISVLCCLCRNITKLSTTDSESETYM